MAKIQQLTKQKYSDLIAPHMKVIKQILEKEKRNTNLINNADEDGRAFLLLEMTADALETVTHYLAVNAISSKILGIKNPNAINDARKSCYKAIINLEGVYTNYLDVPFEDYKDNLEVVLSIPEADRYMLIKKTGLAIAMTQDACGEDSRWKWSLLELNGRMAVVCKNSLYLKTLISDMDPRTEGYIGRVEYFEMVRKQLQRVADEYRLKYEMATARRDDFMLAIGYLKALRRLALMTDRVEESHNLKRKIDIWYEKMEKDEQNQDKAERMKTIEKQNKQIMGSN